MPLPPPIDAALRQGLAIPAMPLALTSGRKLDERRQRALCRYYAAAGAGGLAVAVHTTQFAIRASEHGLLAPVLTLAAEELDRADGSRGTPLMRVAGLCGATRQAVTEAELARELGYHAGLLSLAAWSGAGDRDRLDHCRAVAEVLPLVGFYLQEAVGGPRLSHGFWREFASIERVVAIKIAPFDRYRTLDVVRAVAESGREDIALYTGNDDNIVLDLLTPYRLTVGGRPIERRIVGGLLGHWSVWTRKAVELLAECLEATEGDRPVPVDLLRKAVEVTDANAAFFDAANGFAGCIAGLHEVLRRQGLLEGLWTLDPDEGLGPGQLAEIDRIYAAYPHLNDDDFVAAHLDEWMAS
ncbi:dihydrodipicolinate synthase family protein [Tundrisphaera lichenicola]|uniref:dihydrodipicolinate synthase family protein n=1 Tax=Tundrisphaera lichenicola TaxID=2029860 RepID=UPI003EBF11F2